MRPQQKIINLTYITASHITSTRIIHTNKFLRLSLIRSGPKVIIYYYDCLIATMLSDEIIQIYDLYLKVILRMYSATD